MMVITPDSKTQKIQDLENSESYDSWISDRKVFGIFDVYPDMITYQTMLVIAKETTDSVAVFRFFGETPNIQVSVDRSGIDPLEAISYVSNYIKEAI